MTRFHTDEYINYLENMVPPLDLSDHNLNNPCTGVFRSQVDYLLTFPQIYLGTTILRTKAHLSSVPSLQEARSVLANVWALGRPILLSIGPEAYIMRRRLARRAFATSTTSYSEYLNSYGRFLVYFMWTLTAITEMLWRKRFIQRIGYSPARFTSMETSSLVLVC